ncbi:hypothetical protein [Kordiimonas marina]|uniref:hypothetical protein n=1 Tax=Kordiimonas marina TaxID=2872312 RepID=UPI001FF52800|nr:hypothetical protein [Kordiimonas marina]MCJ9428338.1 hypothetical protein [Kordiimonas marina]
MQQPQAFDPNFYFGLVADNLLKNLGLKALVYADEALVKMKALGDEEGFSLWLSIHQHLTERAAGSMRPDEVVLH